MKFPLKKPLLVYHGTNTKSGLGQKSGFYPGTYTSKSKEVAQGFGENVETLQVDSSKIFPLADADELKRRAAKAGFGFHGANGRSEANYLKSHGYIGMARGNEVILFPFKKQSVRSYIAKDLSARLRLREFSALRKRIRVKWHPDGSARMTIRDQHGGFNEIGRIETTDSSIVDWQKQKLATRGQIKHTWIDPKFRGMGLATKMYGEAMKQAPRGRLVSDNAQFDGGYAIWNRLQRNKGYKIRENPKADGVEDGFVSRDKRPLFIGRINPAARKQNDLSAKLRLREMARGDYAIPVVEAILGRKLGSGVKDALRNRGQRIHTPPPEFVGKKLKSEAEAQLKGKGLAGERQVQYTDVVPTLVLPDRFRPGEATPQWYTPRYGIHNSQVTPSKLRSILKDGLKAKPAPGGQPPLLFMHPSGESAGVVGKFPRIRSGRDQGTLSFLTENPGDFSYSRGGAPGSITSKVSNKRSWIVDPDFYGGKPLSGKIKQVLDETGTKPIIPETIQGDGVTLLYPKEYFGDYNRNYWAKKIKENRSKNLSAKLRLRELARGDFAKVAWDKIGVNVPSEGVPGAFVSGVGKHRIGTAGFMENKLKGNPRLATKMAIRMGVSPSALTAENSMKRKWIASALRNARNAKELSAKLRLREFGQPISATKKLLRWLKLDGVSVGRPDEIEQAMARLAGRKQVGSYSPSKRSISIGKGSDLNILWHEAGHHKDRKKLLKSKPTWEREVKADNNAEGLLRKFGGNIDHYQMPVDSRGIINRDVARRTPIAPISKQGSWIKKHISSPGRRSWEVAAYSDDGRPLFYDEFSTPRAKACLREFARGDFAIPALGKMLKDRSFLDEFMTGKRGPKLGDLNLTYSMAQKNLRRMQPWVRKSFPIADRRIMAAKMLRKGRAGGDVYEELNLSAKLRLREFVRVMGGADIPASMSQIRSAWRTFKNAAPGKIVRSTTQGSSFGPRGMVVQKAAAGAKIDREALLAGATNTTNYPITSALHEGGHALFNKAMTGSANQQFLPRLGRGPTPEKHPLRGVQIMANEIGANNSAVQVLRGAGVKQDAVSDFLKFRQRGIDSHMRSAREHVAAAPVGLTPQRHQEIKGSFNRWITDWKRSPASPNAKLSVDAPELVKKDFESAKMRLRELARGDYAIPALGKMLKDRSFLEEFMTGKRGPKLGDFYSNYYGRLRRVPIGESLYSYNRTYPSESLVNTMRQPALKRVGVRGGTTSTNPARLEARRTGRMVEQFRSNRQNARDSIAKIIRKGRAGGDVYEELNLSAKLRVREFARGDYAIPALGKMLKDRSLLEEFLTGKRGPKLGDLKVGAFRMDQRALRNKSGRTILSGRPESPVDVSVSKVVKSRAGKEIPGDVERIREDWVSNSYNPAIMFVTNQTTLTQARQRARDQVAKMLRKGRAGGDVYEEI